MADNDEISEARTALVAWRQRADRARQRQAAARNSACGGGAISEKASRAASAAIFNNVHQPGISE